MLLASQDAAVVLPVDGRAPEKKKAMSSDAPGHGVARLPYARGRQFGSLDDYLAHLRSNAAIDLPWWREVRPGLYEHVKRMTGAQRETATRADLMKRFGFTR